ncbi:MAG: response regulator transcription factor, partial [Methylococcales bacterium]|nr:response regulator transcription factor [Methylococcales bacterium]
SAYCPDVNLLAEATNVKEGLQLIQQHSPQLIFLDVEMPFGNAFDLLEQLDKDIKLEVIFVTAFSQYALQAINASAASYLLKPVDIDELIEAVAKVKLAIENKNQSFHTRLLIENLKAGTDKDHKLALPLIDGFEVVGVDEIIRCQANGNFTDFFLADGSKRMICRTLKFYDELLQNYGFMRIHKSHLVKLDLIKRYKRGKGGQVHMQDGSVVDVAPARKQALLDWFR